MNKGTATAEYIMEDPREALRLELQRSIPMAGCKSTWRIEFIRGQSPFGGMRVQASFCAQSAICVLQLGNRLDVSAGRLEQRGRKIARSPSA